jgi:mercuric ion binding protein
MNSSVLTLLCAAAVGGCAVCDICRPPEHAARQAALISAPALEPRTVALRIEGMTCGGCAVAARKALERLDGVSKVEVSYEKQRAVVTYDPDRVTVEQLIAAVRQLGYTATVLAASDSSRSPG